MTSSYLPAYELYYLERGMIPPMYRDGVWTGIVPTEHEYVRPLTWELLRQAVDVHDRR